jgi:hypothetical protein
MSKRFQETPVIFNAKYFLGPYFYGNIMNQNNAINETLTTFYVASKQVEQATTTSTVSNQPKPNQTDWVSLVVNFVLNGLISLAYFGVSFGLSG